MQRSKIEIIEKHASTSAVESTTRIGYMIAFTPSLVAVLPVTLSSNAFVAPAKSTVGHIAVAKCHTKRWQKHINKRTVCAALSNQNWCKSDRHFLAFWKRHVSIRKQKTS